MKTILLIFFVLIFVQNINAENNFNNNKNDNKMGTLISNLDIKKSLFRNNEDFKNSFQKYRYHDVFIENLKIADLLNKQYRDLLINELSDYNSEDDVKAESIMLLSQLLLIRLE